MKKTFILINIFLPIFFSIPNTPLAWSWEFAVFGDTRDNDGDPGVASNALSVIFNSIVTDHDCAFVLITGDLIYGESGAAPLTLNGQFQSFKDVAASQGLKVAGEEGEGVPYYPVRGNHETVNTVWGTDDVEAWKSIFSTLPQDGPTSGLGGIGDSEVGMTYSFTYENALVMAIDEYVNDRLHYYWVEDTITAYPSEHVFLFGHEPAYEVVHSACLADNIGDRRNLLTRFYDGGGTFYFCGHDHLNALARICDEDPTKGGTQGLYQAVLGAGGAPASDFDGEYNKDYPGDYPVEGFYHDTDTTNGIPYHYAYAIVTVEEDLLWLKLYGTESVDDVDWELLYVLVVGGTLESDTSVLTSDIANDSVINFNQGSDDTYNGIITGTGSIVKEGSGKLTFSGDNTYTGTTTVAEGELSVIGDLSDSDVVVNSRGTLSGVGPLKSLTSYGIVNPGNSVGILDLGGGDFTQYDSGTLLIEIDSAVSYDTIVNVDTATLGGTLQTAMTGTYAEGTTLASVIETTGGITGTFSTLHTQITPTIVWKPSVNGNDLDLVATRDYNNDSLREWLGENGRSIAPVLESVLQAATGDWVTIKAAIDGLTNNADAVRAYLEISPQKLNNLPFFSFNNFDQQLTSLNNQMYALRIGGLGNTAYAKFDGIDSRSLRHSTLLAYDGDDWAKFVPERTAEEYAEGNRWFLSISGNGSYVKRDSTDNETGYECKSGGVTALLSYLFDDSLLMGVHAGYNISDSDIAFSGGNITLDSISYGICASTWKKDLYLDTSISGSSNFYDNERNISFAGLNRTARSETFGQQVNVYAGSGYDFHIKDLTIGPTATIEYSNVWIDNFSETGAGVLNMSFDGQRVDSAQLGLGGRTYYGMDWKGISITPKIYASYRRELLNNGRTITTRLKHGGNIFQTTADGIDKDFALVGMTLSIGFQGKMFFNAGYQTQLANEDYKFHYFDCSLDIYF
ncbi:MAG: autotransporter domain-containing protein [Candidatus Omnitrophica bacterium]|nr:autotransporter domain-containing protein [Candidatus Omnitrophota bacterium]